LTFPAKDYVTVNTGEGGLMLAQVFDIAGHELFKTSSAGAMLTLSLKTLSPSVYFVRILKAGNQLKTFMLIKQ
jgi:hypothetical protein